MQFDKDTIALLIQTMKRYGWMDLPTNGTSMYPFIKKGNICSFVEFKGGNVKKGDVLLYHSSSGQLIAHRFLRVKETSNQIEYELKGDLNLQVDETIREEQIIGILTTINCDKKTIYTDDFTAMIWSYIISTFPNISKILRAYQAFMMTIKTSILQNLL
ncbi:MAG: signal peptidase I [Bacillota bacterium]